MTWWQELLLGTSAVVAAVALTQIAISLEKIEKHLRHRDKGGA